MKRSRKDTPARTVPASEWRKLARRFKKMSQGIGQSLRAELTSVRGLLVPRLRKWRVDFFPREIGGEHEREILRQKFKDAAGDGAKLLGYSHDSGALDAWLDALKGGSKVFRLDVAAEFLRPEPLPSWKSNPSKVTVGGETRYAVHGVIPRVCGVSADYCEKLADEAGGEELAQTELQTQAEVETQVSVAGKAAYGSGKKGDPKLLEGKDAVSFQTARQYLGIRERQLQYLMKATSLTVVGKGHNRKITTQSLKAYLPPENPQ